MLKNMFWMMRHKNKVWQGNEAAIVKDKQMTELAVIFLLGKNHTNKGWIFSHQGGV